MYTACPLIYNRYHHGIEGLERATSRVIGFKAASPCFSNRRSWRLLAANRREVVTANSLAVVTANRRALVTANRCAVVTANRLAVVTANRRAASRSSEDAPPEKPVRTGLRGNDLPQLTSWAFCSASD